MFDSISWSEYLTFLAITLVIYYPIICLLFFRKELSGLIKRRNYDNGLPGISSLSFSETDNEKILEELREVHEATKHRDFAKEELMLTLIQKIGQHNPVNMAIIDQFIIEAFPQLEERDRRRIWL